MKTKEWLSVLSMVERGRQAGVLSPSVWDRRRVDTSREKNNQFFGFFWKTIDF
jgi:hypothetical protein